MRFSEVIRELEKNSSKKFCRKENGLVYTICASNSGFCYFDASKDGEKLFDSSMPEGNFNGNVDLDDDDWKEIKQPVTWQEAIEAWAIRKKVRCECNDETWTYHLGATYINEMVAIEDGHGVSPSEITEGKWFIEEDKNE